MKVDLKLSEKNVEHRIRMLNLVKKVVELRKKVAELTIRMLNLVKKNAELSKKECLA